MGEERPHPEEGTKDVLALGYPGHRLDVGWMHREQRCHHGARQLAARRAAQELEQEERGAEVEQQVGEVVAARIEAEELAVQHVRQKSERMPVGGDDGGESPAQARDGQPGLHHQVLGHVAGIVEIDESIAQAAMPDDHGQQGEPERQVERPRLRRMGRSAGHGPSRGAGRRSGPTARGGAGLAGTFRRGMGWL